MTDHVTIAHDPALATIVATSPARRGAQALEEAGFVRDSSTGLHRLRRDTSASVAQRMIRDAIRLANVAGYGVLRIYSEDEQKRAAERHPSETGPAKTTGPGTVWTHHVSADIADGHLLVHASFSGQYGETELLGSYPATGQAATFYTEGGGYFGVSRHGDLDGAAQEFGHPLSMPKQGNGRAAAARATSRHTALPSPGTSPASATTAVAPPAPAPRGHQPF